MNRFLVFFLFLAILNQNNALGQRVINGKVILEEDSTVFPGVTVIVKGTSIGAITNVDGYFEFEIPSDAEILEFKFVGMTTLEFQIGTQTEFNVSMFNDATLINEVLVTALGKVTFSEGLAAVSKNDLFGFINQKQKKVIPYKFQAVYNFQNGMACVKYSNKWGFIEKAGDIVIDYLYEDAAPFSNDLAKVKLNNKWGFIDKTGKTVIPFEYEQAISFQKGKAHVKKDGKWFWIDKTGKCVKDCE